MMPSMLVRSMLNRQLEHAAAADDKAQAKWEKILV
jgi:hypothetical protein